jgi:regulatory protein
MTAQRHGGERDELAPVIPLFGGRTPNPEAAVPPDSRAHGARERVAEDAGASHVDSDNTWHVTWTQDQAEADLDTDTAALAESVEAALLKRLRTRSLSEREARAYVRERELADDAADHVIERLRRHGYLDDAALAEQLVHSGVERKGQGRVMLVQALAKRGIARDVIDAALDGLPDDEAERALEFARQKAHAMRDLDRDTALRRLSGQLARRGYGATALSAARQALDEVGRPSRRPSAGTVRFE